MKLTNLNDTIVISTSMTREVIEKAKQYAPDALSIVKDKAPVFAVNISARGGEISPYGIAFSQENPDGTMFVSHQIPALAGMTPEERKAKMNEKFGLILFNLKKVEEQVNAALSLVASDIATVADSVIVIE